MTPVIYYLVSIVALFFVSIPDSVTADWATESRINHVCAKSYDYDLCRNIFHKHLFSNNTDFKGLTQIAIAQTLLYTSDTHIAIQKIQRAETNKTTRDLYEICVEGYGVLLNQFEEAFLKFAQGDYKSMLFDMQNCERFVNDCDSAVGDKNADVKTRNHQSKVLVKMSNTSGELIGTFVELPE